MSHLLTFLSHPTFLHLGPVKLQLDIVMYKQLGMARGVCIPHPRAEQIRARSQCHVLSLAGTYLGLPFPGFSENPEEEDHELCLLT